MRQKFIISILLLLSMAAPFVAMADNFQPVYADLAPGSTATLQFSLDNKAEYYGFQAEVKLPAGLQAVKKGNDGQLDLSLSSRADGGEFQVNSNTLQNGNLIIGAFSAKHKAFTGNEGTIVNLKVSVAETYKGGTVEVSNIIFIASGDKDVDFAPSSIDMGVGVSKITISETAELKVGESVALNATVLPENATDKTLTWKSSNTAVATVVNGKITAKALGEAVITATCKCGGVSTSCKVTVVATPVTGLEVQDEDHEPLESGVEIPLTTGGTYDLTAVVKPTNATDKNVTWTSSNTAVATVDANGLIEAVAAGKATITASISGFTFTANVVVSDAVIPITGITLDKTTAEMKTGKTLQLTATITPEDATQAVGWSSSDKTIATVNSKGLVTAIKDGKVTITAAANGIKATCVITITDIEVTSVTLDKTELTITEEESTTLVATVNPDDATDQTVEWTSSNEDVVVVDEGHVTAIKPGTATITAEAGGKTAVCTVTVKAKTIAVTGVTIGRTSVELEIGTTTTLKATVVPANATDKGIVWSTSDDKVATVDENGVVTAVGNGTAVITATSVAYPSLKAECKVTVGKTSAAEMIGFDPKAEVKVFDISGSYVGNTMEGLLQGTYIVRQGNNVKKVRIR